MFSGLQNLPDPWLQKNEQCLFHNMSLLCMFALIAFIYFSSFNFIFQGMRSNIMKPISIVGLFSSWKISNFWIEMYAQI